MAGLVRELQRLIAGAIRPLHASREASLPVMDALIQQIDGERDAWRESRLEAGSVEQLRWQTLFAICSGTRKEAAPVPLVAGVEVS